MKVREKKGTQPAKLTTGWMLGHETSRSPEPLLSGVKFASRESLIRPSAEQTLTLLVWLFLFQICPRWHVQWLGQFVIKLWIHGKIPDETWAPLTCQTKDYLLLETFRTARLNYPWGPCLDRITKPTTELSFKCTRWLSFVPIFRGKRNYDIFTLQWVRGYAKVTNCKKTSALFVLS